MSAKVNMEAPPKEPDPTPLDQSASSHSEDVVITGSDVVPKKPRPQPHTTTAFLLQGELRSEGVSTSVYTPINTLIMSLEAYLRHSGISKNSSYWSKVD